MEFVTAHGMHLLPGILAVAALVWSAVDALRTRRQRRLPAGLLGQGTAALPGASVRRTWADADGVGTVKVSTLLLVGVAALSAGAAVIHVALIGEHAAESWVFGAFFLVVGAAQVVWVAALAVWPGPATLVAGLVGNAAVVGVWLVSRTVGLPLGPDAGTPEPVGGLDGLATLFEVLIGGGCLVLLFGGLDRRRGLPRAYELLGICAVLVVAVLTLTAVAGGTGGHTH